MKNKLPISPGSAVRCLGPDDKWKHRSKASFATTCISDKQVGLGPRQDTWNTYPAWHQYNIWEVVLVSYNRHSCVTQRNNMNETPITLKTDLCNDIKVPKKKWMHGPRFHLTLFNIATYLTWEMFSRGVLRSYSMFLKSDFKGALLYE